LVQAELARIENRDLEAMRLYDQAIRSARENDFAHNEALANELAARFYAARGFETISHAYLREAHYGYTRWGAAGKARQLEATYPHLRMDRSEPGRMSTIESPVEHLDLATVIKVSEAVSGEMLVDKLIDRLMRTAIEQAGAERGLLILSQGTEPRIEAEATTSGDTVMVQLRQVLVTAAVLPESVLHYVLRTRECAILDDASAEPPFATDPYVIERQARSILCLPLINQAKLVGVLYLENTLAPHVFAPARIAVLKLLASQAAIALENARLYRDLSEREAKIRRLVEANVIGITIWQGGQILEANEAFLRIVGYDREDLEGGRLRWTDLTPPEWLEYQERVWVPELKRAGTVQPFEKEYFRKDGERVPVLIGMAAFDEQREQGVCFVVDLTERKRSEEALRESEERFRTLIQFSFEVYWESDAQHRFTRQEFGEGFADAPALGSEIGKTRWEVPFLEPDAEGWRKHRETLDALCLPQIKSGYIGGAVRPGSGDRECVQLSRRRVISARLCATTNACACHCNSSCTKAERDADGVRRTPRHDQYIPGGLNRSVVPRKRFARVSEETSDDLESRWIEPDAGISRRRRHRGPGSGNVGFAPSHTPPLVDWRSIRPSGAQ